MVLFIIGMIKTVHKQCPKVTLKRLPNKQLCGRFKLKQLMSAKHSTYVLAWVNKKLKRLVSTRAPLAEQSIRHCAKLNETKYAYQIAVPRLNMVKRFLSLQHKGYERSISPGHPTARKRTINLTLRLPEQYLLPPTLFSWIVASPCNTLQVMIKAPPRP